jgi:uncharacterized protein Yka (UPF0111/DUF47 family)
MRGEALLSSPDAMVIKTRILDLLGERVLLLPEQVNRALAANDRVKYLLTLLQAAKHHADAPEAPFSDLRSERLAAGVPDEELDGAVAGSQRSRDAGYSVPQASQIHDRIQRAIGEMLEPLLLTGAGAVEAERFEKLRGGARPEGDRVPAAYFAAVTHARRDQGDGLHLLVMDLHKQLNGLQAALARESIDGALAYAVAEADRARVRAFMRGVNSTAPLKFEHPGLATTATRSGDSLVIENDIGTTDAHVLVVHVRGNGAVVTYTDVHPRRAEFFMSLFERAGARWDATRSQTAEGLEESGSYVLCTGRFEGGDEASLEDFLTFLGSRIVFLIDWNKARKRLRHFMGQGDAIDLLKWAAEHTCGHRGFLELGGERLIYETLEAAGTTRVRYGERLDRVLGRETVLDHLRFVLRTAAQGLLAKRSTRLIRDEIKADLLERLHTAEEGFFALLADQAALAAELAEAVRSGLADMPTADAGERLKRVAERAKHWETQADQLVGRLRENVKHSAEGAWFARFAHDLDDVADMLEEAAFLLPLLPAVAAPASFRRPLVDLATLVLDGAHALVSCLETAVHVQRGGAREDLHDLLEAVDRIVTVEHDTDAAERQVTLTLIAGGADHRQLHLLSLLGQRLEKSADAMARCALLLRDRVMEAAVRP